jgi:hypothetical protein
MKKLALLFLLLISCQRDHVLCCTITGQHTAGCLVNGETLIPKGSGYTGPALSAFYEEIEPGKFMFSMSFVDKKTWDHHRSVEINVFEQLVAGETYTLAFREDGYSNNAAYDIGGGLVDTYETTDIITGEVTIAFIDEDIVAGNFWFDAVNDEGDTVEVREGYFDVKY